MSSRISTKNEDEPSYIDYEAFLAPDFSPASFTNSLVLATNNPSDSPLDLSTPLSRVLFDTQEVDSHIDLLTTRAALPLLEYTREQSAASGHIVEELDVQIKSLNESYRQLEKEVIDKHTEADEVRTVAVRLWEALRLGRSVARCLQLGRQLEVQHAEIAGASVSAAAAAAGKKEDHRALVRCAHTILSLREVLDKKAPGEEGHGLDRVDAIRSLQEGVISPIEKTVRDTADRIVRDFSIPPAATFAQVEETRARTTSALATLYLLSPTADARPDKWAPQLLLQSLELYIRGALNSSIAGLARALAQLPGLERALADVAARCQNLVALEAVLAAARAPAHPLLPVPAKQKPHGAGHGPGSLLQPLLARLETGSLASYFWRSLAGSTATRVTELANRGGVAARTLKANRRSVGDAIRECVIKGCQPLAAMAGSKGVGTKAEESNWDREAVVMVASVVNNLGR